jgi:hypothetical protein
LRHNVEHPCTIGDLVELILTKKPPAASPFTETEAAPRFS